MRTGEGAANISNLKLEIFPNWKLEVFGGALNHARQMRGGNGGTFYDRDFMYTCEKDKFDANTYKRSFMRCGDKPECYIAGADIFDSIFPTLETDFETTCHNITYWISNHITYILSYKLIIGILAAILYWSLNPNLDFQIRVFKSFIAFIFSEVYMLYNVYMHIIKPAIGTKSNSYM